MIPRAATLRFCFVLSSAVSTVLTQPYQITEMAIPTARSAPAGIVVGADGSIWFTELNANRLGRMTPGGVFTEYAIPASASGPEAITATPDGHVWFTEYYGRKIGRISESGGTIAEFAVPGAGAFPTGHHDRQRRQGVVRIE